MEYLLKPLLKNTESVNKVYTYGSKKKVNEVEVELMMLERYVDSRKIKKISYSWSEHSQQSLKKQKKRDKNQAGMAQEVLTRVCNRESYSPKEACMQCIRYSKEYSVLQTKESYY